MAVDADQQQSFPNMPAPVVDENRQVTDSWRFFFVSLWNRTGGASGGTVVGPENSTVGNIATYANEGGTGLADSGYGIGTTGHNIGALDGANTYSAPQRMDAGSAAAPGLAVGSGASGFYAPSAGQIGLTLLGTIAAIFTAATAAFRSAVSAKSATATPAAATATAAFLIGADGIGIYWGTGTPNGVVTAVKASLYLRADDGTLWQNTDGATAWTAR